MSNDSRTLSPEERRARYLDVARRLFVEHGFDGTTTDMIVAEVGGSKATLYRYFPTKEDLVGGLIQAALDRSQAARGIQTVAELPLREALFRFGLVTHEVVVSEAAVAMLRLSLGEVRRFPQLARAVWDVGPARSYEGFKAFLRDRHERGELEVPDLQLGAEQFLGTIAGHIQLKVAMGVVAPPSPGEMEVRVEAAVETFLARYATRANPS